MTAQTQLSRGESLDLLDKVFEKVRMQYAAQQYLEERLNQIVEFPNRIDTRELTVSDSGNESGTIEGTEMVHLFQRIEEEMNDNPLADDETIGWTVTDLSDGAVTMKNQPSWSREKTIEPFELTDEKYTVKTTADGNPRFAY